MKVRMPADSIIAAYSVRTGTSAHPVSKSSFLQGTPPQVPTKGSQALSARELLYQRMGQNQ
jgi:hypothetical protein